uniref:Immunoglobulin superfamily member 22 n=1 Tax=Callorhinchus milii TaxID=7868 RepID=A0A4W3GS14_CALMI
HPATPKPIRPHPAPPDPAPLQVGKEAALNELCLFPFQFRTNRSAPAPREERKVPDEKEMWEILVKADKKDYERICIEYGFTDFRGMLKRLKEMKKKFPSALKNVRVREKGKARLECELSSKDVHIKWLRNGQEIKRSPKVHFIREGRRAELIIEDAELADSGDYTIVATQDSDPREYPSSASLTVEGCGWGKRRPGWRVRLRVRTGRWRVWVKVGVGKGEGEASLEVGSDHVSCLTLTDRFATVKSGMSDCSPQTGQNAEFCVVLNDEKVDGVWLKDGKEVSVRGLCVLYMVGVWWLSVLYEGCVDAGCSLLAALRPDPPVIDADLLALLAKEPITVKAGQTATIKIPFHGKPVPKISWFRDGLEVCEDEKTELEKSPTQAVLVLKACVREDSGNILLKLKSDCGTAVANLHLNVIDKPKPPHGSLEFLEHTGQCVSMKWKAPRDNGGKQVTSFVVERKLVGKKSWVKVGEVDSKTTSFSTNKVEEGTAYQFRVRAVNSEGISDPLVSDEVFAGDPIGAPGLVKNINVTDSTNSSVSLAWEKPEQGDEPQGYILEMRAGESKEWTKCSKIPITSTSYTVGGLQERNKYFFRIRAVNEGGVGDCVCVPGCVCACWTVLRVCVSGFVCVRVSGCVCVRAHVGLVSRVGDGVFRVGDGLSLSLVQGSPPPTVMWLKDGTPAKGKETITKGPKMSQFLVPSAQRSDSALYRILLRNEYGEKYHDLRVRVAGTPAPRVGTVCDVPNTVTLSWDHTPDNMEDGRAHYVIMKRDASTATWFTVAERVHGNKYTVTGLLPGRKYYFRVIARNDIGDSEPLDSREPWYVARDKERFDLNLKKYEEKDRSSAPKFITPLRNHNAQRGRDCTMSCAVSGNPRPHITWYKGKVNLSDKLKYWHTSSTGVCTLTVPSATTKDTDDYTIVAENTLGRCKQCVYVCVTDKGDTMLQSSVKDTPRRNKHIM